ncbi:ATP-binding protein [Bailinhaonella thermotolerans]|uniref:ATP-binding protein n=1 Tax=Bailinhaonella thermotolerans TaxID=1070861 RepID=A0A3A4A2B5_9ACTN|nr:ATP-binding protein [Bailinhaonella thermotolerans]RJL20789.1 ATP-binding protein [Bailinhaonella thermotolerans]
MDAFQLLQGNLVARTAEVDPEEVAGVLIRQFPALEREVTNARAFISGLLGQAHPHHDDAVLLTSEIATNAIRYARPDATSFSISAQTTETSTLIAITDAGGTTIPLICKPADQDPGGRGLFMLDTLATTWGFIRTPTSTGIWFTLKISSEAEA